MEARHKKRLILRTLLCVSLIFIPFIATAEYGQSSSFHFASDYLKEDDTKTEEFVDPSLFCNCYEFIKETYYPELPPMRELIGRATPAFGDIAVMYYPKSGLYHFVKTQGIGYGVFYSDEANYKHCARTQRPISFNDPHLLGFVDL